MRAVVQRVRSASVDVRAADGAFVRKGEIGAGLLVFLGVENGDTSADADWLVGKISALRIFEDADEKMNLSVLDVRGGVLVVSQFTLFGNVRKGSRPSFNRAAPPAVAIPLYEMFAAKMSAVLGADVPTGEFGAMMNVSLVNDGPVTIILDSKNKEI